MLGRSKLSVLLTVLVGLCLVGSLPGDARELSVRVNRWLEFRRISGNVRFTNGSSTTTARIGHRLQSVGDAVITGNDSSARLAVDTQVGFVMVSENSHVRVTQLRGTQSGGRITELSIDRGQARLQVRPFTNPESRLNIRTPAGVSGVRGTEFGVSVQGDGRTGIATLEGAVEASAEGESVMVEGGFQSMVVPGEPPTPPEPLRDDPFLDVQILRAASSPENQSVADLSGFIDPFNIFIVGGEPQTIDRTGRFELQIPLPDDRRIPATVITPLGTEQAYELVVP